MKNQASFEFFYQLFALLIAIILVHAVYVSVIRPNAQEALSQQSIQQTQNPDFVPERSAYIVLKDYEQESCFILFLWAIAIMGYKAVLAYRERSLLHQDLIQLSEGESMLPEDAREYSRPIQALPEAQQNLLMPRALLTALDRFRSTRSIQDTSSAIQNVCEIESERLDSELSMIRYIAWAIPSIGFIGTVRGIGDALGQAQRAVEGDIAGVTESLGVAFNSTLIALLLSILLMFAIHQLQLFQERLVLDVERYCDRRLLRHLQVRE